MERPILAYKDGKLAAIFSTSVLTAKYFFPTDSIKNGSNKIRNAAKKKGKVIVYQFNIKPAIRWGKDEHIEMLQGEPYLLIDTTLPPVPNNALKGFHTTRYESMREEIEKPSLSPSQQGKRIGASKYKEFSTKKDPMPEIMRTDKKEFD